MDIELIRNYCLSKNSVSESLPFDEETLVFKVVNKMFCLMNMIPPFSINLKCDPSKAIELREKYSGVRPGYHMNKKHWNTVELNSDVPDCKFYEWIDDSYNLVVNALPLRLKKDLMKKGDL